jgi:thiol:disulfide interchange protein DsbA
MNLAKLRGVLTCLLFLMTTTAEAQVERYVEGLHYERLPDTSSAAELGAPDGRQSVLEIFWWGCGHCYAFDPLLNHWVADRAGVQFARTPMIWNGTTKEHARLFYTVRTLGKLDEMHDRIFNEIHARENYLLDAESVVALLGEYGVDAATAEKTYHSFGVDLDLRKTEAALREVVVPGVPALVINNQYLIMSNDAVPTHQAMLDVAAFLLNKES